MPMQSKAQNRAMHAAAAGRSNIGIPQSVARKFVAESHGQKIKKLPERKRKKASTKRERIFGALDAD
jgi:hypothetical protein